MSNTLTYKGGGVIQIMNTSDLNALSQQVLEFMASNNGPGAIYNASGTGNVLIGTFTDTRYSGNVGEGNVTVLSSTSDLYQDLSTPTGTEPPRPLRYTSSSSPMQSMSDAQVNTLADSILQYCVLSEGPFSYQLANTTPSDGGTWTSVGQFNDTSNTTTVFYLWKKLNSGSYTITRPLRSLGNGTIQAFTNTEITQLSKKVRERIVNTGVGQYLLQSSTPTPGTWVSKGSVTDTRPTISDANYDGSTEVGYTTDTYTGFASFSGFATFGGFVPANYIGPAFQTFTGPGPATYTGQGNFVGFVPAGFVGPSNQYFLGPGPATTYTGATLFGGFTPAGYLGGANAYYQGPGPATTYTGTTYFILINPDYTVTTVTQYVGPGPEISYDSNFTTFNSVGPNVPYTGTRWQEYFGPGNYTTFNIFNDVFFYTAPAGERTYIGLEYFGGWTGFQLYYGFVPINPFYGPSITYIRGVYYTSASVFTGLGQYISNPNTYPYEANYFYYTGILQYSGPYPDFYTLTGFQIWQAPPVPYTGNYFTGPGPFQYYVSFVPDSQFFVGPSPANYTGNYFTGPGAPTYYVREGTATFIGPSPVNYVGFQNFSGTTPTSYQSNPDTTPFTGPSPVTYTGPATYLSSADYVSLITYTGTVGAVYTGSVINDDRSTISTLTLWRRVA